MNALTWVFTYHAKSLIINKKPNQCLNFFILKFKVYDCHEIICIWQNKFLKRIGYLLQSSKIKESLRQFQCLIPLLQPFVVALRHEISAQNVSVNETAHLLRTKKLSAKITPFPQRDFTKCTIYMN